MVMERDLVTSLVFMCTLPPPAPSFPCHPWQQCGLSQDKYNRWELQEDLFGCSHSIHNILLMAKLVPANWYFGIYNDFVFMHEAIPQICRRIWTEQCCNPRVRIFSHTVLIKLSWWSFLSSEGIKNIIAVFHTERWY